MRLNANMVSVDYECQDFDSKSKKDTYLDDHLTEQKYIHTIQYVFQSLWQTFLHIYIKNKLNPMGLNTVRRE